MDDIDLTQLDLTDPETRKFAEGRIDLSDPETKKWWDSTATTRKLGVPLVNADGTETPSYEPEANTSKPTARPSTWDMTKALGQKGWDETVGENVGIDASNQDAVKKYAGPVLFPLLQGGATILEGANAALNAGIAGGTGLVGGLFGADPSEVDRAAGSLVELSDIGGLFAGGHAPNTNVARRLTSDAEAQLSELFGKGTTDEIVNFTRQNGMDIDPAKVAEFTAKRDAGDPITTGVSYEEKLAQEAKDFVNNKAEASPLEAEAAAFKGKAEPTPEDLWPSEETLKLKEEKLADKLETEAKAFVENKNADDLPSDPFTVEEPSKGAQEISDHAKSVTEDWKNAPDVEAKEHFDDLEDVDPSSLGIYNPEDGRVLLNAKAIEKEADHRGLSVQEMTNTVLYHEGLGHYGLAQKFRDELDFTVNRFYEQSAYFKRKVDRWMKDNPDSYRDEDTVVRAGEEVLAEMSESGRMPVTYMNQIKNKVKDFVRDMGLNLDFSEREIKTILAQAHDAVINGKGADVAGNGYRSMKASNDNRIRISDRPSYPAHGASDEEFSAYYRKSAEHYRARAAQTREDGNTKRAERYLHQASLEERTADRRDPTSQPSSKKSASHHRETAEYYEKKAKQAFDGGNAKRGQVYQKEAERARLLASKYAEDALKPHPMKSTYGSGSDGPLQGPASKDIKEEPSTINKFRSNRNIEDIIEEAAPEKTKESWSEWIDSAEKTRMTGKIAASLAKGTEVPELLAAQEFALKSANRIHDLSRKVASGNASRDEMLRLGSEMNRLEKVSSSITDVVANAARILNSRKIEVATDKTLTDSVRRMLATADLTTPEGIEAAAKQLIKDENKARRIHKTLGVLGNILNLPRSIMSSFDLSAPFRQGLFLINRPEFWKSFPSMFRQFGSEKAFQGVMADIKSRGTYKLMDRSGLAFSELGYELTSREEQFVSQWAEKIPVLGRGIRASERGYTGFLNKVRADTFDSLVTLSKEAGIDLSKNTKALKDISSFVNNATGRGDLGKLSQAGPILSGLFFSPRLIASRVNLLNPAYYVKLSPVVRKEAIKSLLTLGALATTVTSLAFAGGAEIEVDPRSSDFAKIKTGNTRYDILGGFGQYLTLGARLASNETKTAKGEVQELGKKFGSNTRLDVLLNFGINKESPVASFITDYLRGKNAVGETFDTKTAIAQRFIPLFLQDLAKSVKEHGATKGAAMAAPSVFGIGSQTYDPPKGYDVYGRSYAKERVDDPTITELKRLQTTSEETVLGPVGRSLTIDGKRQKLADEDYEKYQNLAGYWTLESVKEVMSDSEWSDLGDDEKIAIVSKLKNEARKAAREELFSEEPIKDEE